jgi:crotonobetainyl-CoA:carnitine CoA-transferase CaiB-like acyl-CoA transferase
VTTVEVPGIGPVTQLGHTYRLGRHQDVIVGPPPAIDQHREEILEAATAPVPGRPVAGGRTLGHALEGIRVLDLGTVVAGPFGTMILADLGAEVISIEPVTPAVGTAGDATWVCGARGKRSIALNLKDEDGREVLHRLIAGADVLHYNLRPGVAERLGFGYEEARAINPRLVFCQLTAYGSSGPLAGDPGTDQMAQALSGLEWEQGAASRGGHPTWYRFGMTDAVSGMLSVLGVLQALYRREQTGLGQAVETDILSAGLLLGSDASLGPDGLAGRPPLDLQQTGLGPYDRLYETHDGWICVVAPDVACRARLHQVLGLSDGPEVDVATLEAAFRARSAAEWQERLDAAGVPAEVARDCGTAWYDDPHAVASGWVASYDHPVWGRLEQPGEFVSLAGTPGLIRGAPPLIGQHTEEVLQELGYQRADIERLQAKGAVGLPTSSAPPWRPPRSPSGRP